MKIFFIVFEHVELIIITLKIKTNKNDQYII